MQTLLINLNPKRKPGKRPRSKDAIRLQLQRDAKLAEEIRKISPITEFSKAIMELADRLNERMKSLFIELLEDHGVDENSESDIRMTFEITRIMDLMENVIQSISNRVPIGTDSDKVAPGKVSEGEDGLPPDAPILPDAPPEGKEFRVSSPESETGENVEGTAAVEPTPADRGAFDKIGRRRRPKTTDLIILFNIFFIDYCEDRISCHSEDELIKNINFHLDKIRRMSRSNKNLISVFKRIKEYISGFDFKDDKNIKERRIGRRDTISRLLKNEIEKLEVKDG